MHTVPITSPPGSIFSDPLKKPSPSIPPQKSKAVLQLAESNIQAKSMAIVKHSVPARAAPNIAVRMHKCGTKYAAGTALFESINY